MKRFILVFLFAFVFAKIKAQPGTLDSSFGTNGQIALGSNFTATAFQQDGHLVGILTVNGDIVINRFDANGLDANFGNGGTKTLDLGSATDRAISVAVSADNKIVVLGGTTATEAGALYNVLVLSRYNSDGTPDNTFGNGRIVKE